MKSLDSPIPIRADAGLLVIHGVGTHARKSTLKTVVDPLLQRLDNEGLVVEVASSSVGGESAPDESYDALVVRYRRNRSAPDSATRTLLAVEGLWTGVYAKSSPVSLLTWAGTHSVRMTWELLRYHVRSPIRLLASVLIVALIGAGVYFSRGEPPRLGIGLVVLGALVAFATASQDAPRPKGKWRATHVMIWLCQIATLTIYQFQRGLVILVTLLGLVVLPVIALVASWLESIPFAAQAGTKVFDKVEGLLLNGGAADMEAVSNNFVSASDIRTRLRGALEEIEQRVVEGGTITVVAHSGGCPPAWSILSEPAIVERQKRKSFRYRLITVGAALNWAMQALDCRATPIEGSLVHSDAHEKEKRTIWANVYSTWDPVPHGPAAPLFPNGDHQRYYKGWRAWDEPMDAEYPTPNRAVRNLGAPVADEHGEYWRNQHEFVPMVTRAIDEEIVWPATPNSGDTCRPGEHQALWSNVRLALLGPLVRARLVMLALPAGVVAAAASGRRFLPSQDHPIDYHWQVTRWLGVGIQKVGERVLTEDVYGGIVNHHWLEAGVAAVVLVALAYGLMDVYTNFFWQSLGRRVATIRPERSPPGTAPGWLPARMGSFGRLAIPRREAFIVWAPTLLFPLLLFPFGLGWVWAIFIAVNIAFACAELLWLNACLLAFDDADLQAVCSAGIGRMSLVGQMQTPAGAAAFPAAAPVP